MRTHEKEAVPVCFDQINVFYWKSKTAELFLLATERRKIKKEDFALQ